jgi:hypothetical protein
MYTEIIGCYKREREREREGENRSLELENPGRELRTKINA